MLAIVEHIKLTFPSTYYLAVVTALDDGVCHWWSPYPHWYAPAHVSCWAHNHRRGALALPKIKSNWLVRLKKENVSANSW